MSAVLAMGSLAGCKDKEALENQQAYRQVGMNKLSEGSYEEAVEAFQKALDQSKAVVTEIEIDTCYYKATAQYKSGDVKGALETCKALIDYNKKDYKAYYLRGCIYMKEEDRENAMKDYRKSFETSGNDYEMYVSAYENLKNAGWDSEAELETGRTACWICWLLTAAASVVRQPTIVTDVNRQTNTASGLMVRLIKTSPFDSGFSGESIAYCDTGFYNSLQRFFSEFVNMCSHNKKKFPMIKPAGWCRLKRT